jgi:tetratricopeptide (TPR) repeat protein
MNVSYILEGSGQKYGNNVRLTFQLIDTKNDEHLWSSPYSREIDMAEIFNLQSEIAQLVAAEIEAIITPDEKELIEKVPTSNLTAYDLYQRGREEQWKYRTDKDKREALERAEDLYLDALEYDSTFALAYTGLASVYWDKRYWETYFSENFLDSVLILADIAISHDNQIAEAYIVKGDYYRNIGQDEQAIKEYDRAIRKNPNSWMAYASKGGLWWSIGYVKAIENLHKAASLNRGSELPTLLGFLGNLYYYIGFREEALIYLLEKLKLNGDSGDYYQYLSWDAFHNNEFTKGIEFGKKALEIDSSSFSTQKILGLNYSFLGQYEQSLKYLKKSIGRRDTLGAGQINYMHRLGYAYWQNGYEEEADYYFDKQIDYCNWAIELGRNYAREVGSYYDLAGVYAFRGDKDRVYENLRLLNQKNQSAHFGLLCWFKKDPLFEHIRNEPEFQQILKDTEAKYQAEHERVRQWLEENDML